MSLKPVQDRRKELIFQQKLFLQLAEEWQPARPWITYFAAIKHFRVITANEVATASFNDLRDKEFATEVAGTAEILRKASATSLDSDTLQNLDYLCQLQEVAPLAEKAKSTLADIAASKHYETVLRIVKGEKQVLPKHGCGVFAAGLVLGASLIGIGGAANEQTVLGFGFVFCFVIGLFGAFLFFYSQVRQVLVDRFQSIVVPAAQILACNATDWLKRPAEAQSFLDAADANRQELERTYLSLT